MPLDINAIKQRMQGAVDTLEKEFVGLRTGRASVNMLEPVTVEIYGARMPLNQVGTISVPEPRLLTVQVWDRNSTKAVEKAIRDAGLGLNPQGEGSLIAFLFLNYPPNAAPNCKKSRANMPNKHAWPFATSAVTGWIRLKKMMI